MFRAEASFVRKGWSSGWKHLIFFPPTHQYYSVYFVVFLLRSVDALFHKGVVIFTHLLRRNLHKYKYGHLPVLRSALDYLPFWV